MDPLTDKQRGVLNYIAAYVAEHGYPPSMREIALTACGSVHVHTARCHLKALERKGYISRVEGKPRTIHIIPVAA